MRLNLEITAASILVLLTCFSACSTPELDPTLITRKTLPPTWTSTSTSTPSITPVPPKTVTTTQQATPATQISTPTKSPITQATAVPSGTEFPIIKIDPIIPKDLADGELIITEIQMTSETSGWAFTSSGDSVFVLHTSDGGNSWRNATPPIKIWSDYIKLPEGFLPRLGEGYFLDGNRAWISTERIDKHRPQDVYTTRIMLSTSDAGKTWQMRQLPPEGFGEGHFPGFIDSMHGWFALLEPATYGQSYTGLYRTENGGESWEIVLSTPGYSSGAKRDFAFGDPSTGVLTISLIGWHSGLAVWWTHDGGANWKIQSLPEPENPSISDPSLSDFECGSILPHAFSEREVTLIVECRMLKNAGSPDNKYIFSNYLYSTKDGGLSWQSYPAPSGVLHLISQDTGWMFGKEIHFTNDGGVTWTKINDVSWEGQFSFIDANHGWAVARSDDEIALVKTENGGRSWMIVKPRLVP